MPSVDVVCAVRDEQDRPVVGAAIALGDALGCAVRLVHATLPTAPAVEAAPAVLPTAPANVVDAAVTLRPGPDLEAIAASSGRPELRTEVVEGPTVDVLRAIGQAAGPTWLVVGDAGRGAFSALLHGSASRRLLDVPGGPLVVVPREGRRVPLTGTEPVACLVAGEQEGRVTAPLAGRLAAALRTRVVLVAPRAARSGEEAVQRAFAAARTAIGPEVGVEEVAVPGSSFAAVAETSRAAGARVLVIDPADRGALGAAVVPTVTHELVADADQVVVVARPSRSR